MEIAAAGCLRVGCLLVVRVGRNPRGSSRCRRLGRWTPPAKRAGQTSLGTSETSSMHCDAAQEQPPSILNQVRERQLILTPVRRLSRLARHLAKDCAEAKLNDRRQTLRNRYASRSFRDGCCDGSYAWRRDLRRVTTNARQVRARGTTPARDKHS